MRNEFGMGDRLERWQVSQRPVAKHFDAMDDGFHVLLRRSAPIDIR